MGLFLVHSLISHFVVNHCCSNPFIIACFFSAWLHTVCFYLYLFLLIHPPLTASLSPFIFCLLSLSLSPSCLSFSLLSLSPALPSYLPLPLSLPTSLPPAAFLLKYLLTILILIGRCGCSSWKLSAQSLASTFGIPPITGEEGK